MNIAVLGWGSLVWDKRDLNLENDWIEGGPLLPLEFSRISSDGRLTLVIDQQNGADVITCYAKSKFSDLGLAVTNLQKREGMPTPKNIGIFNITESDLDRDEKWKLEIVRWVYEKRFDAIIWTALPSNFIERQRKNFSISAAIEYISSLDADKRALALRYFRNAPSQIRTPLRLAVEQHFYT